jgi:hypothetical protein
MAPRSASLLCFLTLATVGAYGDSGEPAENRAGTGPQTAKAAYERLLAQHGRRSGYSEPFTNQEALLIAATAASVKDSKGFLGAYRWLLSHSSEDWLNPLLDEVLTRAPKSKRTALQDVHVGLFPLSDIQVSSERSGNDGVVVLIHHGLVRAFLRWTVTLSRIIGEDASPEEETRAFERIATEVESYARTGTFESSLEVQPLHERSKILATALTTRATQFTIAHECGHALLGHLDRAKSGAAHVDAIGNGEIEVEADLAAAELLGIIHSDAEPNDPQAAFELDLWRAGANVALGFLELIQFASRNQRGSGAHQMTLRRATLFGKLFPEPPGDSAPLTRLVNLALQDLTDKVLLKDTPLEDLDEDARTRALFRIAHEQGDRRGMLGLVAKNRPWFRDWANQLRATAAMLPGRSTVSGGWTGAKRLGAAELEALATAIDEILLDRQPGAAGRTVASGSKP